MYCVIYSSSIGGTASLYTNWAIEMKSWDQCTRTRNAWQRQTALCGCLKIQFSNCHTVWDAFPWQPVRKKVGQALFLCKGGVT